MTVNELLAQLRTEMTGDVAKDIEHLHAVAEDLVNEENADELTAAVADFAFGIMPEDVRGKMEDMTMIDGRRMDLVFRDALQLVNQRKNHEAEKLLKAISDKLAKYYEGENPK